MTAAKIAVLGAGGHGKVVIATAEAAGFIVAAIFDDREEVWGQSILGHRIVGPIETLEPGDFDGTVLAIGRNAPRKNAAIQLEAPWVTVVHPSAQVHRSVVIGAGTVVFAGAVLQPDTAIGHHSIINTSATVDHDCEIADYSHIAPGANLAGNVTIGEGCLVGVGAALIRGVAVGAWATVGVGAAVISDVPGGVTVVGVPARALSSNAAPKATPT